VEDRFVEFANEGLEVVESAWAAAKNIPVNIFVYSMMAILACVGLAHRLMGGKKEVYAYALDDIICDHMGGWHETQIGKTCPACGGEIRRVQQSAQEEGVKSTFH